MDSIENLEGFLKKPNECRQNGVAEMLGGRKDVFHKTLQSQLTKFMATRHLNSYLHPPLQFIEVYYDRQKGVNNSPLYLNDWEPTT